MLGVRVAVVALCVCVALLAFYELAFIRRCSPAACQPHVLDHVGVRVAMARQPGHCAFGELPGVLDFNVMKPAGGRWQSVVPDCPLRNLLASPQAVGGARVLLLGDSADAHLAHAWCSQLGQPLQSALLGLSGKVANLAAAVAARVAGSNASSSAGGGGGSNSSSGADGQGDGDDGCCADRDAFYWCSPAAGAEQGAGQGAGQQVSVAMHHLLGVHLHGPYHTGAQGSFLQRVPAALRAFTARLGGPPDLVMLHSNFWDQSRMWEAKQPGYGSYSRLLPETVFSFSSNFSLLVSTTRELLPEAALLLTRTAPFPALNANWLGRWSYVHQLNAAAVEVSRLHGLDVIDLEGMTFGLEPGSYLADRHHPGQVLLLEAANIALNLLAQHRTQQRKAGAAAAEPQQRQQQERSPGQGLRGDSGSGRAAEG